MNLGEKSCDGRLMPLGLDEIGKAPLLDFDGRHRVRRKGGGRKPALPELAWVCSFPFRHEFELPAEEHDGHAECFGVTIASAGSSDGHDDAVHSFQWSGRDGMTAEGDDAFTS